jgi:hypothetical protein
MKTQARVRTRHDEWFKRALQLWLGALGDVQVDARIAGESRRGDVLYTERRKRPAYRRKLGVLGDLARGIILFEVFRNPLTADELTSCVLKGVDLLAQQRRAARRQKNDEERAPTALTPASLCIITPSMSADLRIAAETTLLDARRPGLHRLAPIWRTSVVVVNELPADRSTCWLRLLGREKVQASAVKELVRMSRRDPLRDATLELLGEWQDSLPPPAQQSEDERELKMNLDQLYNDGKREGKAEGKREGKREGKAEGKREGKAEDVLAVLEVRGVPVSAAQRRQVLACTDPAQLDAWVRAAVTTTSAKALLSGSVRR